MNRKILKIFLIFLFLGAVLPNGYWYYQLVRLFGTAGFLYLAYLDYKLNYKYTPIIFIILAIVVNPIEKVTFGRDGWIIVDILLAIILLLSFKFEDHRFNYKNSQNT